MILHKFLYAAAIALIAVTTSGSAKAQMEEIIIVGQPVSLFGPSLSWYDLQGMEWMGSEGGIGAEFLGLNGLEFENFACDAEGGVWRDGACQCPAGQVSSGGECEEETDMENAQRQLGECLQGQAGFGGCDCCRTYDRAICGVVSDSVPAGPCLDSADSVYGACFHAHFGDLMSYDFNIDIGDIGGEIGGY